jgi:regulator of sigma E protease
MTWILAFAGFAALIILHEFGHFAAAKAVGMRVEKFSLFFGPMLVKVRRGETEYGIAPIPLGGYVKITGMNPREEIDPDVLPRAYYKQPVWKRLVVISAGPAMNLLVAFVLLLGVFWVNGWDSGHASNTLGQVGAKTPAAAVLRPGDQILSVDGVVDPDRFAAAIAAHGCAQTPAKVGCVAATPAHLVIKRDGATKSIAIYPRYTAAQSGVRARPRIGVGFNERYVAGDPIGAAGQSVDTMWQVTSETVTTFSRLFTSQKARDQVQGVVGAYTVTSQAFGLSLSEALGILALISLSLAIINLFPFLPLDGGHIFWALAEKVRGRPIPVQVMEQASFVGIALVGFLFVLGLQNSIHTLTHGGFHIH